MLFVGLWNGNSLEPYFFFRVVPNAGEVEAAEPHSPRLQKSSVNAFHNKKYRKFNSSNLEFIEAQHWLFMHYMNILNLIIYLDAPKNYPKSQSEYGKILFRYLLPSAKSLLHQIRSIVHVLFSWHYLNSSFLLRHLSAQIVEQLHAATFLPSLNR